MTTGAAETTGISIRNPTCPNAFKNSCCVRHYQKLHSWLLTPLLAAVDRHSQRAQVRHAGIDPPPRLPTRTQPRYWFLWGLIADAVKRAKWIARLDTDRHPDGTDLLSAVFLTSYWKDNVRHWRFLNGYANLRARALRRPYRQHPSFSTATPGFSTTSGNARYPTRSYACR